MSTSKINPMAPPTIAPICPSASSTIGISSNEIDDAIETDAVEDDGNDPEGDEDDDEDGELLLDSPADILESVVAPAVVMVVVT